MDTALKEGLCRAFCEDISLRDVPAGLAVSTAFNGPRGEPIGFYIVGPDGAGAFRIQDDGRTIPFLEAAGVDLSVESRRQTFADLLSEYDVEYDDDSFELYTAAMPATGLPRAAMSFVAMLLRVQDLLFVTQERVATTFKQDVVSLLREAVGDKAKIEEREAVSPALEGYEADLVIRAEGHEPVAVFLATYDSKIQEALILQLLAQHEARVPCKVVALLEAAGSVSPKLRQRADNRLDAVPVFKGDEAAAIAKIQRMATGEIPSIH